MQWEAVLYVQHAVAATEEKAGCLVAAAFGRTGARRRRPVDDALGFPFLLHRDELQLLDLRIRLGAHAQIAQHGVRGATGWQRGLPVPQRQQQTGATYQCVGEMGVPGLALRGGRCGRRRRRRQSVQLDAAHLRMLQQLLQAAERLRIEIGRVVRQRHRQQRLDADAERQGGLGDQQVRARGHADQQAQLCVGQVCLELTHEIGDRLAQARQLRRLEVAMS